MRVENVSLLEVNGLYFTSDIRCPESLNRIFDRPAPNTHLPYDYIFNLGGETRYSQPDEVYRLRNYTLSMTLGKEAAKRKCSAFIECSTGMVYKPSSTPRKETDKLKPWLKLARWKLTAEEDLAKIEGLNLCILRFGHVYGDYCSKFMGTALSLARVFKELDKELKWLWTGDLRINTVHVTDVARALWTAATYTHSHPPPASGPLIYNIVDHASFSQKDLANLISAVFSIPTGFQGQLISQFARLSLDSVVDDVNEETLQPWADMLQKKGITRPGPLTPFLEKELLKDTDLSLDGSKFEAETGFRYEVEKVTERGLRDIVSSYEKMGWWP
jgi:nucleoside-diphosphate-sugar epimerase